MASNNYYITTSIPYVNAEPHIGFGMEIVQADVLARAARVKGKTVLFSTGTDEHGSKIAETAAEAKLTPKQFTDKISEQFRQLCKTLNISNDRFIRTTDKAHEQRAQIIWKNLQKDIYRGKYTGWYCVGHEEYFSETAVKANNNVCPDHNRPYEKLEEENYFFGLSKYSDQIKKAISSGSCKVTPTTRKNEILSLIDEGLKDISVSRPKDKIGWGIPVPGDPSQVMYVWFEALMNYITVLGYPEHPDFKKFWPASVQVIGKDILRFHAAVWPGLLLALNLPLPKVLYVHGHITVDDKKMGKSLGNVVTPDELVKEYGADAFRYFFLRHIPSYADGNFSHDKFIEAYNNELANELGNALSRTAAMIIRYQQGLVGDTPPSGHDIGQYSQAIEECHFDRALDEVWEQVRGLNQYIDEEKPWEVAKTKDADHLREILAYQVSCLLEIADLLLPFMPESATKIQAAFKDGVVRSSGPSLFPKKDLPKTAITS